MVSSLWGIPIHASHFLASLLDDKEANNKPFGCWKFYYFCLKKSKTRSHEGELRSSENRKEKENEEELSS
jgi:hypothetical protein